MTADRRAIPRYAGDVLISFSLRASTDCAGCRAPLPINGLVARVNCAKCGEAHTFDKGFWHGHIRHQRFVEAMQLPEGKTKTNTEMAIGASGMRRWELVYGRQLPHCPACATPPSLAIAALAGAVESGHCFCPACGHAVRVRAADGLAQTVHPSARFVVGETALTPEEQALARQTHPVMFKCEGCGAGLPVDGTKRLATCQYCQAGNYLPDGLWQELNPVPKPHTWFLVCELDEAALHAARPMDTASRLAEAASATAPIADLAALVHDREGKVRCALASNPRAPSSVLKALAHDRETKVQAAVAVHPSTPHAAFVVLAKSEQHAVLDALAANPALPADLVEQLAAHERHKTRAHAAAHPNLSLATLHKLAHDSHTDVANAAKARLAELKAAGVDVEAGRGFFQRLFD